MCTGTTLLYCTLICVLIAWTWLENDSLNPSNFQLAALLPFSHNLLPLVASVKRTAAERGTRPNGVKIYS